MKYQIPSEVVPSKYSKLAVNPLTPWIAGILGGFLPGIIWSSFNAFFLGCRDAKRQAEIAILVYVTLTPFSVFMKYLRNNNVFKEMFGDQELLVYFLMRAFIDVAMLGTLMWMSIRQSGIGEYLKEIGQPLKWGISLAVALAAFRFLVLDALAPKAPYLFHIWGM